jgi:hypothetical protein
MHRRLVKQYLLFPGLVAGNIAMGMRRALPGRKPSRSDSDKRNRDQDEKQSDFFHKGYAANMGKASYLSNLSPLLKTLAESQNA